MRRSRGVFRAHAALWPLVGLLISAWGGPVQAQIVQGRVLDRGTRQGVEGALVLLVDQTAREVDGALTDGSGVFRLQAPGSGGYVLRVERIGYETVTSAVIRVGSESVSGILLETRPSAIELEELRVEGEQQCVVRPAEGLEMARVWDEARKALTVQEWAEGEGLYRFRIVQYQRDLHPDSRAVLSEERERKVVVNRNPIRSLPAEELLEGGFVRTDEAGVHTYYGPDAAVLLSDLFLDTHCFRLSASADAPDLVGLAFEPVRHRRTPDIEGTLWLDRATAELVRLDYGYDWAPWDEVRGVAEGRVEFQKMPTGAFIVRRWWIRMPALGRVRNFSTGYPELKLVEIKEVGSEVAEVTSLEHRIVAPADRRPRGALQGLAWDSLRSRPLAGATVFLSGTQYEASAADDGRFFLEGIPVGDYAAAVVHPSLDSLGMGAQRADVRIDASDTASVRLGLPSKATFLASMCGAGEWTAEDAFVTGTVRQGEEGARASGATVTVAWSRSRTNDDGVVIGRTVRDVRVVTDGQGRYRACGIPAGARITVRASTGAPEGVGPPREVELNGDGVVVLDLTLPPPGG